MKDEKERKPYNPYTLAGGYAAKSMPDKKTSDVFQRLCAHANWVGETTVGIATIMDETRLSHGSACDAVKTLKALGRIEKQQRAIQAHGGRQTAITKVYCNEQELRHAGASKENFYDKGGRSGLLKPQPAPDPKSKPKRSKVQNEPIQSPSGTDPKSTQGGREPFHTSFKSKPLESLPLQAEEKPKSKAKEFSTQIKGGKEGNSNPTPPPVRLLGTPRVPPAPLSPPTPLYPLIPDKASELIAAGCPQAALDEIQRWRVLVENLNKNTGNLLKAYRTLVEDKPKLRDLWLPPVTVVAVNAAEDPAEVEQLRKAGERIRAEQLKSGWKCERHRWKATERWACPTCDRNSWGSMFHRQHGYENPFIHTVTDSDGREIKQKWSCDFSGERPGDWIVEIVSDPKEGAEKLEEVYKT